MNDVSVIVPTFNRARMLVDCISSLLAQSRPPLEIIVVDDGSSDGTADLVRRMPAPVRYLHQANSGKPAALNLALPQARGHWIWFFDDDDVALPHSIEARLLAVQRAPRAELVVSRFLWGRSGAGGRLVAGAPLHWPAFTPKDFYQKFLRTCFAHMNGALFRCDRISTIGGFRTDLLTSEDYDFTLRVARASTIAVCDEPTFIFRQHTGARGPARKRYAAADRVRNFAAGDAAIGRTIRATHHLAEYVGESPDSELGPSKRREAMLARMEVMAGKGLLREVAEDTIELCHELDVAGLGIDTMTALALKSALQEHYLSLAIAESPRDALEFLRPLQRSAAGRESLALVARAVAGSAWWQPLRLDERLTLARFVLNLAAMARSAAAEST